MVTRAAKKAQDVILVHSKEFTDLQFIDVDATEMEYDRMSKREVSVPLTQVQEDWIGKQTIFLLRGFNARKYSLEEYIHIWDLFVSRIVAYIGSHPASTLSEINWDLSRNGASNQLKLSWNGTILSIDM